MLVLNNLILVPGLMNNIHILRIIVKVWCLVMAMLTETFHD